MSQNLNALMQERANVLARYIDKHFTTASVSKRMAEIVGGEANSSQPLSQGMSHLTESVRYSILQEGGKRFRPVLTMLVAEALGHSFERVLPYAAAVECIHTYSLIHDDLPAMDNDDFRRGQPTNHKKFGESTAILAGDALLTEAFLMVSESFQSEPDLGLRAVTELSKAAGLYGMVGGQAIDMHSKKESVTLTELEVMHRLKTGALIQVCAIGGAILCHANEQQMQELRSYAGNLGLAFQVADDLLDYDPNKIEPGSYPALLGVEKTKVYLEELTNTCFESLTRWSRSADPLREIARYNQTRTL